METTSLRQRIIDLKEGERLTFQMGEVMETTLRGYACNLGLVLNRSYSVNRNRKTRTYTISWTA